MVEVGIRNLSVDAGHRSPFNDALLRMCKSRKNFKLSPIGHVRYINILTWLRGFQFKLLYLVLFSLYLSLFWELRDKRNLKNLQF